MDELNRIHQKEILDDKDNFFLRAVSDYLRLLLNDRKKALEKQIGNPKISFHYLFIVPTEWDIEIRENLLRPIFIQANLISQQDHNNKLLFFTQLESIFQLIQSKEYKKKHGNNESFHQGEQYIICRLAIGQETLSATVDLLRAEYSSIDIVDATLVPNLIQSTDISMNNDDVKNDIKRVLKSKIFPDTDCAKEDNALVLMAENALNYGVGQEVTYK